MQLSMNQENDHEIQINKLIETSKTKFTNDPKIYPPLEHLKKLYSITDKTRVDKTKFETLVEKCQESINSETQTILNFAEHLLKLIKFLEEFKLESNTSKQQVVEKRKALLIPISNANTNKNGTIINDVEDNEKELNKSSTTEESETNTHEEEKLQENNEEEEAEVSDNNEVNEEEGAEVNDNNEVNEEERELKPDEAKALANIKKLDEFCQMLNKRIIEYEKSDLSFEDMNSEKSKFLVEDALKTRFNKAYNKMVSLIRRYPHLCELDKPPKPYNKKTNKSFKKITSFQATRYPEINKKITDKINKLKMFPNYADIIEWVSEANQENNLALSQEKIERLSKDSFEEIGRHLKRSRYNDDIKIQNSRIKSLHPDLFDSESTNVFTVEDPALKDPEIDKILNDNKRKAEELCEQIFEEFSKKQANNEDYEDDVEDENDEEENVTEYEENSEKEPEKEEIEDEDVENLFKSDTSANTSNNEIVTSTQKEDSNKISPANMMKQSNIQHLVSSVLKTKSPNKRNSKEDEKVDNKKTKLDTTSQDSPMCSKSLPNNPKIISSGSLAKKSITSNTPNEDSSEDESFIVLD